MSCEKTIRPVYIGHPFPRRREKTMAEVYNGFQVENTHFSSQPIESTLLASNPKKLNGTVVMWYVYTLECRNKALYTGITNNLDRRFREHLKKTTHYTGYNPPLKILYKERFSTKSKAMKREAQIKGWTRRKKLALIEGDWELLKKL